MRPPDLRGKSWLCGRSGPLPRHRHLNAARRRKLLLSGWLRCVEWEFWPQWAVYLPVLVRAAWLGVKHRGWTVFTAVNPAMPHGGLALESKHAILKGLTGGTGKDERVARWRLLESSDRWNSLEEFRREHGLVYPVVLKPDVGERGKGVAIIQDAEQAKAYLERCPQDVAVIVQEYVTGEEFGVFYVREPDAPRGEILSITRKTPLALTGDGKRALVDLILEDPRGLRNAGWFLAKHEDRLSWVPEEGERVVVGELGTHCRGALFTDARECATEALRSAVDDLAQRYEGFYFGRFDLKVPDEAALREGRGLRVLELNGVSSESAHIYDPSYRAWRGWKDLCWQWDLAFRIGAANRDRGHRVSTVGELIELVRAMRDRDDWEIS